MRLYSSLSGTESLCDLGRRVSPDAIEYVPFRDAEKATVDMFRRSLGVNQGQNWNTAIFARLPELITDPTRWLIERAVPHPFEYNTGIYHSIEYFRKTVFCVRMDK